MFLSSRPFLVFDHYRVPYRCDIAGVLADNRRRDRAWLASGDGTGPRLYWPVAVAGSPLATKPPRRFRLDGLVLHGRLLGEEALASWRASVGGNWETDAIVTGEAGERLGGVWRADDGSRLLPFDPEEVVTGFWSERYANAAAGRDRGLRSRAVSGYYRLRPFLPRAAQIAARRAYSRAQARTPFPRWPVEESLHGFFDLVLDWCAEIGGGPVPWIAPWPAGRRWALVLTHDVETADGVRQLPLLRDVELRTGYRSAWNFVPRRYSVDDEALRELADDGFEIGVHGLHHDGRDIELLAERLPEIRAAAQRWGAAGFRSPATHRAWEAMSGLPFEYDSSYPDTDPFEPQPGGCCSWWPYFIGDVVELPITLVQDHTLFVILGRRDGSAWLDKTERIRAAGGLALLITHPDYVRAGPVVPAYEELLDRYANDPTAWRALPRDVARWWRRRAGSSLERANGRWRVVGAAADEAQVQLTTPASY